MSITPTVKAILANYESDNPGTKGNIARMLMQGRLGGTGKMVILPVDQGFEHGPARSFAPNPEAYDPHYHFQLAIDAGLSAYAAPLGMLEAGADTFAGQVPTILKVNSSNSWATGINQAVTGGVDDALRLGCVPVDRGKRGQAIAAMMKAVQEGRQDPGQLIIYPEGTRTAPGAPPAYKVGSAVLYAQLGQSCVPAATNVGVFWPRHGFYRKPGLAVVEFLPAISPGLSNPEFMAELEQRIETASNKLIAESGFIAPVRDMSQHGH
jgi:hypothetical protein